MRREIHRIKPVDGQRQLFGEPDVTYCRACGRRLRGPESCRRRLGPSCWKASVIKAAKELGTYCEDHGIVVGGLKGQHQLGRVLNKVRRARPRPAQEGSE